MTTDTKAHTDSARAIDSALSDAQESLLAKVSASIAERGALANEILPNSAETGIIASVTGKSDSRLTVAEKAFARGLKALRDKNYTEARRQLAGFLELISSQLREQGGETAPQQSHTLQGIRVVVEALELLLAISEEITILEADGR